MPAKPLPAEAKDQFYSLAFGYVGPKYNIPTDEEREADRVLLAAENLVLASLKAAGYKVLPQYVWPDGSLYLWLRVPDESVGRVACAVELALAAALASSAPRAPQTRLTGISSVHPDHPDCCGGKSVRQLFEEAA